MSKKENFILNTFLSLTEKTYPYGTEDDLVYDMIERGIFPKDIKSDKHGNYSIKIGESRTIFSSHLDTVGDKKEVTHIFINDLIKTDGKSILGADDKAGVVILLHLIKNKVPGLYYFFAGEEVGCIGSGMVSKYEEEVKNYDRIISFDRRGTTSVITYQSSSRCCSDEFADSLCSELNKSGFKYKKDEGGVYTDSAEFTKIIPECTNISVGYQSEHTVNESQDIKHLELLADACLKINWEELPTKRDPSKVECRSWSYDRDYSYTTPYKGSSHKKQNFDRYSGSGSLRPYEQENSWNSWEKEEEERTKKSKKYYDNGSGLVDITKNAKKFNTLTDKDYYEPMRDSILETELTLDELFIVKQQYLDMNDESDIKYYEYLLTRVSCV